MRSNLDAVDAWIKQLDCNWLGRTTMINSADKRGELIKHLEDAIAIADELDDGATGYLIERALDEARAQFFRLPSAS
jgi:hypothetical protein